MRPSWRGNRLSRCRAVTTAKCWCSICR